MSESRETSRRRRGYRALTQGMVAVAAGEVEEAARWAKRADDLLDEPPLTMLLSAQAAQLSGDEAAAKRYFTAMLDSEETRFLGLRGLLTQALRSGDQRAALEHVREAYALRPTTPWVLTALFDLSERHGDLETAQRALKDAARVKALPQAEARRKRAVLALEQALAARRRGEPALKLAREARRLAPDLVPANVLIAELMIEGGDSRRAARLLEEAWELAPHPDLADLYLRAVEPANGLDRLKRLDRLVASRRDHPESHLALARAALAAHLWGEARRHLREAGASDAPEQAPRETVCRLMAELEEAEHGDSEAARVWLARAADAPADPGWVCRTCGAASDAWSARCGACGDFDGLVWQAPPRVAGAILPPPPEPEAVPAEVTAIAPPKTAPVPATHPTPATRAS